MGWGVVTADLSLDWQLLLDFFDVYPHLYPTSTPLLHPCTATLTFPVSLTSLPCPYYLSLVSVLYPGG